MLLTSPVTGAKDFIEQVRQSPAADGHLRAVANFNIFQAGDENRLTDT